MTQTHGHTCHMIQIGVIKFLVKTCFEITFLNQKLDHTISYSYIIVLYPRERGPTAECRPTPHFGLNFLLRSNVYSNIRPCVAALENTAQMAGL